MKISVQLTENNNKKIPNLLAFADITLDDSFVVKGLKIINGSKGLFVSMPSEKAKILNKQTNQYEEKYIDKFYPKNQEARAQLNDLIIKKYREQFTK